jgi:hypothetical protein
LVRIRGAQKSSSSFTASTGTGRNFACGLFDVSTTTPPIRLTTAIEIPASLKSASVEDAMLPGERSRNAVGFEFACDVETYFPHAVMLALV